ncbi:MULTISPECIES: flagellar filament capping protein FliD [Xanthomonas]|jgi:flagellar hook-associated protein 2|uniref:Flagellar hook-associated protein 2 n=1 Tax=Xanthomonas campestris pv. campestris (strain B100) TaxID=509169 RepID=B0RT07_XANCB|nr:flagellar filament capping protein FliD [Xanthomonas campestris]AKS16360.1 flagellar protein [Xanthomonas campestris pv. campestris]AKS20384.1 flagellar protein [Xanthomonas campestris pv. campestris]ALE68706.1 flagellar protein [Xanthomonas campestris pv. campestris]MCC3252935.1 flagellar filament capping protein FliD [Xanthomonas campestris pv. armoraciae]MCC5047292.1 flagellar filament capping protein FliD [Xanthomonas campestris]
MASVISTSSSGLDIPTVVSTLVSRQKDPEQARINKAGTAATTQLSAISQIKSSMTTLKSALDKVVSSADTNAYKASVPTDAGFTATTTSSAAPGNYSVEVVSLASAQKLASGAFTADATVGSGTLTIGYGDKSITVDISGTDKLTDIAAAINKAAGGKGVTASVVTANDGQHLVFNAVDTGTKGALTVSASDPSLSALTFGAGVTGGLTQQVAAADALVRVDGFERTSSSNTVTDIVPGVVLNLTKAAEGTKVTLGVTADTSGLKGNLTAFAAAYNTANTLLKNSSSYNAETRTASALTGDSLVRGLQQQLRGQVSGSISELKALGLTIDKDGVMSFDGGKFDTAIAADGGAAAEALGKDSKFGSGLTKLLDANVNVNNGTLTLRSDSLNKQIKGFEADLDNLDARMEKLTDRYTAQFTAMETMISKMQGATGSLSSLLAIK